MELTIQLFFKTVLCGLLNQWLGLNKTLRQIHQETGSQDIEEDQDAVIEGFHCLHAIWDEQTTGQNFKEMFTNLKAEITKFSLILGTMVEQTRNKMLTGIVAVNQATRIYEDFPGQIK
ncbi:hypothetical protein E2320_017177 [Naja naja]|nr:hypothetical protein E2320_017177 [Naja naja]